MADGPPAVAPDWEAIERTARPGASSCAPDEQDVLLARVGSDDPALAAAVKRLVDAGRRAGTFLEQPAASYAGPLLAWVAGREPLEPGATLGPYEIVRRLGRGATATVFLARDPKHRRSVAVKVLHPDLAAAVGAERFLREIEIAATLQHPHILPLFDSGAVDGLLYYVMPHVEGESLRQRLVVPGPAAARDGAPHRRRGRRRARLLPPPRSRPPGHQAREHPAAGRPGDRRRFRHRPRARRGRACHRGRAHVRDRHAGVHEPRAEPLRGGRRAQRPLLARLRGVRDAGGPGAVRWIAAGGSAAASDRGAAAVAPRAGARAGRAGRRPRAGQVAADRFDTAGAFAEALHAGAGRARPRARRRLWRAAGAAAVVAAVALAATELRSRGPVVVPEASRIAVLPFDPVTTDSVLARVGEDVAATVNVTLDRLGGITTVDRFATLTRTAAGRRSARSRTRWRWDGASARGAS